MFLTLERADLPKKKAIVQLIEDPRFVRFNVLIREGAKGLPFADVNTKAAYSPQLF